MDMHNYHYIVQETDLDFLGHVNNSNYVKILEQARWDLITHRNYSLKRIQELKQCPVILSINIKYTKELKARDQIIVKTQSLTYEGKVGTLKQKIVMDESGQVACSAIITYGLFDMNTRRLILPTKEWLEAITTA